jgi:hypothetical protein
MRQAFATVAFLPAISISISIVLNEVKDHEKALEEPPGRVQLG